MNPKVINYQEEVPDHLAYEDELRFAPNMPTPEEVRERAQLIRATKIAATKDGAKRLVTVKEAAGILGVSTTTVKRRIQEGSLQAKKVDRYWQVDLSI